MREFEDGADSAFLARLQQLKLKVTSGFRARALQLRSDVERLATEPVDARRSLKIALHQLQGIAGTFGHRELSELAGQLGHGMATCTPRVLEDQVLRLALLVERASLANTELTRPEEDGDVPVDEP